MPTMALRDPSRVFISHKKLAIKCGCSLLMALAEKRQPAMCTALNFLRDILRVSRDCLGGLSHALFGGFLD